MTLLLDPAIRDWVVLPLLFIIIVAGLLRQEVSMYLALGGKEAIPSVAQRAHCLVQHCRTIHSGSAVATHALTSVAWQARQQHVIELLRAEADELLRDDERRKQESSAAGGAPPLANDPMEALMKNPMGMLGGNMVFMVQNMVRFLISYLIKTYFILEA